jgi:hypothetical protein
MCSSGTGQHIIIPSLIAFLLGVQTSRTLLLAFSCLCRCLKFTDVSTTSTPSKSFQLVVYF